MDFEEWHLDYMDDWKQPYGELVRRAAVCFGAGGPDKDTFEDLRSASIPLKRYRDQLDKHHSCDFLTSNQLGTPHYKLPRIWDEKSNDFRSVSQILSAI